MRLLSSLVIAVTAFVDAHYVFPSVQGTADWSHVRITANHYSNGPVTDVTSTDIRCYQLATGNENATITSIAAGSTLTWTSEPAIYHPGPLTAYMGKVPSGQTADTWDGSGAAWFKIYQDTPTAEPYNMVWPNQGLASLPFTIPSCLCGDYLFRIEHLALHSASSLGGAQFYLSCAPITVTSSSCSDKAPASGSKYVVSFPGAYTATDPGILFNLYGSATPTYTAPGPPIWTCGAS